jgi:hypothetical protein
MSDNRLEIEVTCHLCRETHRLPLDASGHWSGAFPCDDTKHGELQIAAEQ